MVLSLDKDRIARCFLRSLESYDRAALVQHELAERLLKLLDNIPEKVFDSVLEIGCGTGTLTESLCRKNSVNTLYCNDLVKEFASVVSDRLTAMGTATKVVPWFGDIEEMKIPAGLSLVISGATFQWLSNLPGFLQDLGRQLLPGSCLAFSMFGPGTLKEFSSLTNISLGYTDDEKIKTILADDFELTEYRNYKDTLYFPRVKDILAHIRETGVGGVSEYSWSKRSLIDFERNYMKRYADDKGLPVSYVSSCFLLVRR